MRSWQTIVTVPLQANFNGATWVNDVEADPRATTRFDVHLQALSKALLQKALPRTSLSTWGKGSVVQDPVPLRGEARVLMPRIQP